MPRSNTQTSTKLLWDTFMVCTFTFIDCITFELLMNLKLHFRRFNLRTTCIVRSWNDRHSHLQCKQQLFDWIDCSASRQATYREWTKSLRDGFGFRKNGTWISQQQIQ